MAQRGGKLAPAAAMAFYILMLGLVLALAAAGGVLYGQLTSAGANNNAVRASLSYTAARLRSADSADCVRVVPGPEGDALVLADAEADGYVTRIYAAGGQLYEEYVREDADFDPAQAQAVAQTQTFAVQCADGLWRIVTDAGEVCVALHTEQGASE